MLERYFDPVLREGVSAKVHVYGPIGSGKTVLCKRFGSDLEARAAEAGVNLRFVRINLAYTPKPYFILTRLLDKVSFIGGPRSGISPEEMLFNVAQALREEDCTLVLALDEVDTYISEGGNSRILYMLSRIHELYPEPVTRVSLIYVSRSLGWMKRLDPATLDTLGRTSGIHLEEYTSRQMMDILMFRAEEASYPGTVSEKVIRFIIDISRGLGGLRYALELLRESGGVAASYGSSMITSEHVRLGNGRIPKGVNGAYYPSELSLHKQLFLSGVVQALQEIIDPYCTPEDVYEMYRLVCREYSREPKDKSFVPTYLRDLKIEGYIRLEDNGSLVGTDLPLEYLEEIVEKALEHTFEASDTL